MFASKCRRRAAVREKSHAKSETERASVYAVRQQYGYRQYSAVIARGHSSVHAFYQDPRDGQTESRRFSRAFDGIETVEKSFDVHVGHIRRGV